MMISFSVSVGLSKLYVSPNLCLGLTGQKTSDVIVTIFAELGDIRPSFFSGTLILLLHILCLMSMALFVLTMDHIS